AKIDLDTGPLDLGAIWVGGEELVEDFGRRSAREDQGKAAAFPGGAPRGGHDDVGGGLGDRGRVRKNLNLRHHFVIPLRTGIGMASGLGLESPRRCFSTCRTS